MEYKKAIDILMRLSDKRQLSAEEKEAVWTAISTLDLASLAEKSMRNRIKMKKAKRDKEIEL